MDKKYVLLILFLLVITMLIPVNYSYATIKETTLTLDPVHKDYRVGEEIIFTGKLVDSEKYMLSNEEIKIMPSSTLSRTIGNDLTDARGNFRIVVPAELWNGDGGNVSFIAYYGGSDKFKESKSNVIVSEMRKLYTPLGKEFEYETLKEQGYFKQKSAPDNSVNPQPKIPTQTNDVNVPSSKDCPDGAYHGVDNQGNEVCRDIKTNTILTILEKNQQTGGTSSKDTEQTGCANPFASGCLSSSNLEIILFIVVIIVIITSIIIVKNKNKMTFGCRHNFEYSRGHFSCSKCGKRGKERQYKRNHNKSYAGIIIIGVVIIVGIYIYGNYDVRVDEQKLNQMVPLNTIEQKFDELYKAIPIESIDSTIQEFSDRNPIIMEEKSVKLEDKLLDCSKYKKEYLEANKNVRTTEDNMAAMMGDALAGVQKTKACEQYNKQIEMQQASQGTITSEPVSNVILHGAGVPPWTGPDGVYHNKPPIVGTFSIEKIIVSEKEYYRTISLNLNVKAENLHLDDEVLFSPLAITLKNEKGTLYLSQPQECSSPMAYHITGKTDPNLSITVCYDVEKEFKRFDVFFGQKIGSFTLN